MTKGRLPESVSRSKLSLEWPFRYKVLNVMGISNKVPGLKNKKENLVI